MRNSSLKTAVFAGLLILIVLLTAWYLVLQNANSARKRMDQRFALQNLQQLHVALMNYSHAAKSKSYDAIYPSTLNELATNHIVTPEMLDVLTKGFEIKYHRPTNNAAPGHTLFVATGHGYVVTYPISGECRVENLRESQAPR
ncbi:MAG: hypothetical protein ABIP97_13945 [Chthoniobacterales bacterium]